MKASLYIRVSTTHQIDKDSLPFQREELINYAKYALGIDDFEVFEDAGFSGKNTDRPKYQEMMSRIRNKEFSHLLVWKIDRISRNLKDFTEMYEELKSYNVTFVSKNEQFDTSSAMGEAMLKIILVFAELERKLTAERVYSIMLSRAEKGLWNGATIPLGYKWSDEKKFPVIDENEASTVKYIYDLYNKYQSSLQVAHRLNTEKVPTKRGGKWTPKTINDVLRNPFYIGTYRYNVKTGVTRRLKDKKEWIVREDNHEGIIEKELFEKVNNILTENFKGNNSVQRANTNTHIFSKLLICGKCGSSLTAGLDSARKDGYRPSRYTCYSNKHLDNYNSCNNFMSDITIMPFIMNYLSNFIKLQSRVNQKHSLRDIERALLRSSPFIDILCIDKKGLEDTYKSFIIGFEDNTEYEGNVEESDIKTHKIDILKREKLKYENALKRLEDLFLFSDEAMSEKDFLFKKRDLIRHLEKINNDIDEINKNNSNKNIDLDFSFLNKASNFFITKEILTKRNIDYRFLLELVDKQTLRDFITSIISEINIVDKKIYSITFKNGLVHNFLYKEYKDQKLKTREKFLYKSFEPDLIEYLKQNESCNRKEVEELTNMSRSGATSLINEFLDRSLIEKKGNSVATRYFLTKKGMKL